MIDRCWLACDYIWDPQGMQRSGKRHLEIQSCLHSLHVLCHRSCCISISFQGECTVPGNRGTRSKKSWNRVEPQPTVFFFSNYFDFPFNKTPKSVNWTKITLLYFFIMFKTLYWIKYTFNVTWCNHYCFLKKRCIILSTWCTVCPK